MTTTKPTDKEQQVWIEAYLLSLKQCVKQLGHRKAPPCVDDADEVARLSVAKFRAFANGVAL